MTETYEEKWTRREKMMNDWFAEEIQRALDMIYDLGLQLGRIQNAPEPESAQVDSLGCTINGLANLPIDEVTSAFRAGWARSRPMKEGKE